MTSDVFEINDYTDATDFERFVSLIYKCLTDWYKNHYQIIELNLKKKLVQEEIILNYGIDLYLISYNLIVGDNVCSHSTKSSLSKWFKLKNFVTLKHIRKLNDIGDYQCLPLNISHNQKLLSALSLALQQFYSNYYASHSSGELDNSILPLYLFTCINEETQIYQGIVQKHCETFGMRQNLTMFYYSQPLSGLTYKDSLIQLLTLDSRKNETCCVVDYTFNFALVPTRKVLTFDWTFFSDDLSLIASEKDGLKRESSILARYLWAFGSTVFPLERIDLSVTWKDLPVTSTTTYTHKDTTDDENNTTDRATSDDELNDELRLAKITNTSRPPSRSQPYFVENERNFNLLEFFDDYYRSYKSSSRRNSEECRSRPPHPQIDFKIQMEFKERRVDERQTVTGILARKLARITQVLDYHHNYYRTNLLMATGAAEEPFLDSREYMKGDHLEAAANQHLQQTLHVEDKKANANHNYLQDPMSNKNNFERAFDKLTIGHHPSPTSTTCTSTENESPQSSFKSIQKTGRDFLRTKNPFTSTVSRVPATPEGGSHKITNSTSNPMIGNDTVNKVISDNLMDALFWILFPDSKPHPADASNDTNYKKLYQLATPLVDDEINKAELPGKKFKLSPPGSLVDVFSQVVFLLVNMDALNVVNPLTNYTTRSTTLPESSAIISYDLNDIHPCMLVPLYNNDKSSNQLITDTNFRKLVYEESITANTQEFHHQRGGGHQQNQMETITRALKEFWREFVLELRYRWDNAIIIPLIDDSKPDYRYSLFYQKLQMLNECIKLKQKQKLEENRPNISEKMATSNKTYTTGQDEKDEDETFYDCDNSPSSLSIIDNNPQNRLGNDFKKDTSYQSVKPEGRSHILDSNIKLFNNRDYLYVPYTQDPPFMTEDQLHEQQLTILQSVHHSTSSNTEFSGKPSHPYHPSRAEMQSMTLKSDMRAFKAANPNSDDLRDFLRWYSPTDLVWISQGDECQLSERMKIGLETYKNRGKSNCEKFDNFQIPPLSPLRKHPDNLWARLWYDNHETSPLPVSRQPRLFNEITNGERALHDISRLTLPDILTNYSGSVALQIAFYASKVYFSHLLPRGSCENLEQVTEKKSKTHYDEMEELVKTEISKMAAYLSKMDGLANEKYGGFAGSSNDEESGGAVGNRPRPFLDRLIYVMDDLENDLATFHCLNRFTETYLPSRPGSGTTYRESFRGADFIDGSDEQQFESQMKQILLRQQRQKSFLDLHEPAPAIKFSVTPSNFFDTKDLMNSVPLFGQLVGGDDLMAKSHSKYRQSKFFGWKNEAAGVMNIRSMFTDLEELKKICQNNYPDTVTATATTTANDNKDHNIRSSIIPIYENTSASSSKAITKPLFLCGLLNKEYLFDEIKIAPETLLGNRERKLYVLVGSKEFRIARVEDCL